jgi:hypothetical protein
VPRSQGFQERAHSSPFIQIEPRMGTSSSIAGPRLAIDNVSPTANNPIATITGSMPSSR